MDNSSLEETESEGPKNCTAPGKTETKKERRMKERGHPPPLPLLQEHRAKDEKRE